MDPTSEATSADVIAPATLTVEQTAVVLGISRTLAYDLVSRGEIPVVRLGRRIVVPRRVVNDLLGSASALRVSVS